MRLRLVCASAWLTATACHQALGYALYAWANKNAGPAFVVIFSPLQIIYTAVLQKLIFQKDIPEGSYIGGALVSIGTRARSSCVLMHCRGDTLVL